MTSAVIQMVSQDDVLANLQRATALLERRAAARAARDFALSDSLRDELAAMGIDVRDTPQGQVTTPRH